MIVEDCNWENLVMKYVCKAINKKTADGVSLENTAVGRWGYRTGDIRTINLYMYKLVYVSILVQGVSACINLYMLVF